MVGAMLGSLWLSVACIDPVGVVRVPRGDVARSYLGGAPVSAAPGDMVCEGSLISVRAGWGELMLGQHGRVRLSAETRLQVIDVDRLRLSRGRLWLETGSRAPPLIVEVSKHRLVVRPGTSAVVERAHGGTVTVFRGGVRLSSSTVLGSGETGPADGREAARQGGAELLALVRRETRAGLGDIAGWRAFVLNVIGAGSIGNRPTAPTASAVKAQSLPGELSPVDRMVEEALRPPPLLSPALTVEP